MAAGDFSVAELRERFAYSPETGVLTYKAHQHPAWIGRPVSVDYRRGYARTRIRRKWVLIHRIAWMIQTGDCPAMIDHINGDRADNRWANLRETTPELNQQNRLKAERGSTFGLLGVRRCWKRFGATIRVNGECLWLGVYDTPERAHAAYLEAKKKLAPHAFDLPTVYPRVSQVVDLTEEKCPAGGTFTEARHARPYPHEPP